MLSRMESIVTESYVLGPARVAYGDGTVGAARIAVARGRVAEILPVDGPSDVYLPDQAIIAPTARKTHCSIAIKGTPSKSLRAPTPGWERRAMSPVSSRLRGSRCSTQRVRSPRRHTGSKNVVNASAHAASGFISKDRSSIRSFAGFIGRSGSSRPRSSEPEHS